MIDGVAVQHKPLCFMFLDHLEHLFLPTSLINMQVLDRESLFLRLALSELEDESPPCRSQPPHT